MNKCPIAQNRCRLLQSIESKNGQWHQENKTKENKNWVNLGLTFEPVAKEMRVKTVPYSTADPWLKPTRGGPVNVLQPWTCKPVLQTCSKAYRSDFKMLITDYMLRLISRYTMYQI